MGEISLTSYVNGSGQLQKRAVYKIGAWRHAPKRVETRTKVEGERKIEFSSLPCPFA
jgi:hypothetical protein